MSRCREASPRRDRAGQGQGRREGERSVGARFVNRPSDEQRQIRGIGRVVLAELQQLGTSEAVSASSRTHASAQSRRREIRSRRDSHTQRRVQPGRRADRLARFLPRRAPPDLRQDGRAQRARADAIDFVTLKEELARAGELEEVGGPAYITSLADGVPRSTNVEHYARIVKEKSTLRSLIFSANKILTEAYEAEQEPTSSSTRRSRRSSRSPRTGSATGSCRCATSCRSSFATIEKLQQHKGLVTGVPTGFVDLDEMTSGLQPSDLDHRRRAAVDGEDEPRAEHRAARRHLNGHDGRLLQPGDVEGAAVHAHAHRPRRGSTRTASAAASSARRTTAGCRTRSGRSPRPRSYIDDTRRSACSKCARRRAG